MWRNLPKRWQNYELRRVAEIAGFNLWTIQSLNNPCIEFIRYFVLLFWLPLQNFPLAANKNYGGFAKIVSLFRDKHSVSERLRYVKP